jgi:membrane protease YdiL (CAAX protease family)
MLGGSTKQKTLAVLEVTVFLGVLMTIAHLALPQDPRWLRHLSITLLWTIPPLAYVILARKNLAVYGLDFARTWRASVHYGFWGFVVGLIQVPGFIAIGVLKTPGFFVAYAVVLASLVVLLYVMRRDPPRTGIGWKLAIFAGLLVLPSLVASLTGKMSAGFVGLQAYYLFGTGFGEEIRARGYVQSRLNEAFGRPWLIWGTQFGPGLLIASALFGLSHLYQIGATRLDPFTMVGATLGGLFFGAVRERSESVLGSALVHGMSNAGLEVYRHVFSTH